MFLHCPLAHRKGENALSVIKWPIILIILGTFGLLLLLMQSPQINHSQANNTRSLQSQTDGNVDQLTKEQMIAFWDSQTDGLYTQNNNLAQYVRGRNKKEN